MLTKERKRHKQLSRGPLRKGHSKNMQQTHRRTPTPKHDLNKTTSQLHETMPQHGHPCKSTAYLQNTPHKNTSGWLLLKREKYRKVYIKNFRLKFMKIYQNETLFIYSSRLSSPKTFSMSLVGQLMILMAHDFIHK